jgi:hypothetical protein
MEMKRIAIALGILITTTAIGSVSAAEMPKELRDTSWCADRPGWSPRTHSPWPAGNYRRCHKVTDADDAFGVYAGGRKWGHDMTDEICEVLRVTSYGKGHFVVRARCNNDEERVKSRWTTAPSASVAIAAYATMPPCTSESFELANDADCPNRRQRHRISNNVRLLRVAAGTKFTE